MRLVFFIDGLSHWPVVGHETIFSRPWNYFSDRVCLSRIKDLLEDCMRCFDKRGFNELVCLETMDKNVTASTVTFIIIRYR